MKAFQRYVVHLTVILAAVGAVMALADPSAEKPPARSGKEAPSIVVSARGSLRSDFVEVRWDAGPSPGPAARIVKVVPDGSVVRQGDVLVEFDSAEMTDRHLEAQIQAARAKAALIQAEGQMEAAHVALEEYREGVYPLQEATAQLELFAAEENCRRAQVRMDLLKTEPGEANAVDRRGARQREEAQFALKKAETELALAQLRLKVLREFTKRKTSRQLQAAIDAARAGLESAKVESEVRNLKLERARSAAEKKVVKASTSGQVSHVGLLREGALVRPGQVILRLRDPKPMHVEVPLDPSQAAKIAPGMPATIRLDAFPDRSLSGTVEKVEKPGGAPDRRTDTSSLHKAIIRVSVLPREVRPGLTAQVQIGQRVPK